MRIREKLRRASGSDVKGVIFFILLIAYVSAPLAGQTSPQLLIQSVPAGKQPLGTDIVPDTTQTTTGHWVAVANSGDDSVSIFRVAANAQGVFGIELSRVLTGIPSPYAVAACFGNRFLVTSPSTNSVYLIDAAQGNIVGTVGVGPVPRSAACYGTANNPLAVVSSAGDSTLSVIDLRTFSIVRMVTSVPGSRGLHGALVYQATGTGLDPEAWIAGTDASTVTLIDLVTGAVFASFPVLSPTSMICCVGSSDVLSPNKAVLIASSSGNSIFGVNINSLQVTATIPNVPTPQDLTGDIINPDGRFLASTGPANALAFESGASVTLIPGFPGSAGLSSAGDSSVNSAFAVLTSTDSNSLFLIQSQPSVPHAFTVSNGASFATAQVAAGQLASLFATTGVNQNIYAGTIPLPKTLGGVSMKIGGTLTFNATTGNWDYSSTGASDVPLVFVGPNQVNFQIPPGIAPGNSVPVQLTKADGTTLLSTVNITATAPGIFSVLMNGQGQGAVLNQNNSQNFGTNPAARGSVIQIFATGGGDTTPALASGDAAPASGTPLIQMKATPTIVTIGGITAVVKFSGMAPGWVGLWQVNAEVPAGVTPGSAVPVSLNIGGVQSNSVTIAVQ